MKLLGRASEDQREGTHKWDDVGPLRYSRTSWDCYGEAEREE